MLEQVILLAKKHKVDVIKVGDIEILVTKHTQDLRDDSNDDKPIPVEGDVLTDDEILFHSSEG